MELSEEEKKAIKYLKENAIRPLYENINMRVVVFETILNLIEKQQKEIEDLKKELLDYKIEVIFNDKFIPEQVIRNMIKLNEENISNLYNSSSYGDRYVYDEVNRLKIENEVLKELLGE